MWGLGGGCGRGRTASLREGERCLSSPFFLSLAFMGAKWQNGITRAHPYTSKIKKGMNSGYWSPRGTGGRGTEKAAVSSNMNWINGKKKNKQPFNKNSNQNFAEHKNPHAESRGDHHWVR